MRFRRTVIAPIILAAGAIGSLIAGPALAVTTAAAPAAPAAAVAAAAPQVIGMHS